MNVNQKKTSGLMCLMMATLMLMSSSPVKASLMLTATSAVVSIMVYSKTCSIFLMSALIISFSSGMMIIMTYASTLVSQEENSYSASNKFKVVMLFTMLYFSPNTENVPSIYKSTSLMETTMFLLVLMMVLILTMKTLNDYILDKSLPMKQTFYLKIT